MKNKIKSCTTFLSLLMLFTFLFSNNIVYAASKQKIEDFSTAIRVIEENYLINNSDGTVKISKDANNTIDSNIIINIEKSMEDINSKIKSGDLYVSNEDNKREIKSAPGYNPDLGELKNEKVHRGNRVKRSWGLDSYTIKYTWKWWGFYADINSTGARRLATTLNAQTALVAFGTAGGAFIPGLGVVIGLSGAVSAATLQSWSYIASDQADMDLGVTCTCLGSPEKAELVAVGR